ncbi:MAG: hypothetical protein IKN15_04650 [Bacteroidaceae bacterium]|nr:hypothetical protein [Bacteroidaceae bacterium]
MKKSIWLPLILFCCGAGVYIYSGITYNAWMHNLALMIADIVIVVTLHIALKKKEELEENR